MRVEHLNIINVIFVGGGIIGLSTALALLHRSVYRIKALERAPALWVGNQMDNNSDVAHAGIYYQPGSLKAELRGRGLRDSIEYFERHGVPYRGCGQTIVA